MDKLIANASVGLAKASMNRRGFMGRLARAAGGAAVLTAGLASVVRADHCEGSHHCVSGECEDSPQSCSNGRCALHHERAIYLRCKVVDCYTREFCGFWHYEFDRCETDYTCP